MKFNLKSINIVYIVAIIGLVFLWSYLSNYQNAPLVFFGFAETKETEINMDQPLEILKIHVVPGQSIKKGALLAEVRNAKTDLNIQAEYKKIELLQAEKLLWDDEQRQGIVALKLEKQSKLNEIQLRIDELKAKIDYQNSLWNGLKRIKPKPNSDKYNPMEFKHSELVQEYENTKKHFDLDIQQLNARIKAHKSPFKQQIEEIQSEIDYYATKSERYTIKAPYDGLIGNVHCIEGEFENAFSTLISFYEANPTQVKGYVIENSILHVALNDSFLVSSIKDESLKYGGKLIGLGSRIVEIPVRMRKMPEIKTYGREVIIEIPKDNKLLQKEKVMLELMKSSNGKNQLNKH